MLYCIDTHKHTSFPKLEHRNPWMSSGKPCEDDFAIKTVQLSFRDADASLGLDGG